MTQVNVWKIWFSVFVYKRGTKIDTRQRKKKGTRGHWLGYRLDNNYIKSVFKLWVTTGLINFLMNNYLQFQSWGWEDITKHCLRKPIVCSKLRKSKKLFEWTAAHSIQNYFQKCSIATIKYVPLNLQWPK